jgi:hypothetical protein
MIAADFLGDPTGTIARSSITAPVVIQKNAPPMLRHSGMCR